jgi:hypothetical protein
LASATPTVPVTLNNPGPALDDYFGNSVAISGTFVVVGNSGNDGGVQNSGSAYVYDLASATPATPIATLNNPGPATNEYFATSVAISGTRIVVGTSANDWGWIDAGSAYVYDLASTTPTIPLATLNNPDPALNDYFGLEVAIDGSTLAIATAYDDSIAFDKGAAYVFGPSPFSLWKVSALNDQFARELGNSDGDGMVNLVEYALLHSPTTPDPAPAQTETFAYPEGQRLRLFLQRDPARNDVTIEVQAAGGAAGPWTTIATSALGAPFTGPGYVGGDGAGPGFRIVEVRDTVNLADASQRFLRVRVMH